MHRAFRSVLPAVLLLIALLGGPSAFAGSSKAKAKAAADSLKRVTTDQRLRVVAADSSGDARQAIEARLALLPLVKRAEATKVLAEAADLAGTAGLAQDELRLRRQLAEVFATAGNERAAFAEAMRVADLGERWAAQRADSVVQAAQAGSARMKQETDSAQRAVREELGAMETRFHGAEDEAVQWKYIAAGVGGLCLLITAFLLYRSGKAMRRVRKEVAALKGEVRTLMERPLNVQREVRREAPVVPPVRQMAEDPSPVVLSADDVLVAMFRKQAPERLATLRAARERADNDKTVRVVHSLKPQLVGLDEPRFSPLCARITAPDAPTDQRKWNADLDALERGVSATLEAIGH